MDVPTDKKEPLACDTPTASLAADNADKPEWDPEQERKAKRK